MEFLVGFGIDFDSPDQQRTTALVKGAVEVLTPILTMTQMPLFAPSWARLRQLLADAEIR